MTLLIQNISFVNVIVIVKRYWGSPARPGHQYVTEHAIPFPYSTSQTIVLTLSYREGAVLGATESSSFQESEAT